MRSGRWRLPAARLLAEVQHLLVAQHDLGVITGHHLEVEMIIENEVIVIVGTSGIRRRGTSEFFKISFGGLG